MNNKIQVVHVNRLKIACNPKTWKPKQKPENKKIRTEKKIAKSEELEEYEVQIGSRPLLNNIPQKILEPWTPPSLTPGTPDSLQQAVDTPYFERADSNYERPRTPRSNSEIQTVRPEPPLIRSRTRVQTQDRNVAETDAVLHTRHRTPPTYVKYSFSWFAALHSQPCFTVEITDNSQIISTTLVQVRLTGTA